MTAALCLVLFAQVATPAAANTETKTRAQALLKEGTALYERGDFAAALEKFEAAYAVYPSPKLQFNIAQADQDLGRPVEALAAFQKFLAEAPAAAPEILAEARASVVQLTARLGQIKVESQASGANVTVDGKPVGVTPLAAVVWTTPGRHQVTIQHDQFVPEIIDVTVVAGEVRTVTTQPRSLAPPSVVPAAPVAMAPISVPEAVIQRQSIWARQSWYVWAAAGATVALGAGAIIAGLSANSRFSELESSCGKMPAGCSDEQINSLKSRATLTNVLWALTGVSAVVTGVAVYVDSREAGVSLAYRF